MQSWKKILIIKKTNLQFYKYFLFLPYVSFLFLKVLVKCIYWIILLWIHETDISIMNKMSPFWNIWDKKVLKNDQIWVDGF